MQSDHYQLKRAGADGDAPLVVTREELRQARVTVAERFPHSETAQGAA